MAAAGIKQGNYTIDDLKDLKVALVHYWLVTWRGGEKVLASLLKIFPKADIYTLFYDEKTCRPYLGNHAVHASCLNLPKLRFQYQKIFPLYPLGIRSLKLKKKYDLIFSSESGPAKGIANPDRIPHICYVHSPMRYCWGFTDMYLEALPKWSRSIAAWQFRKLKEWDLTTIDNVDFYLANSDNVKDRIKQYYGKDATTCYPPIAMDLFAGNSKRRIGDYYLSFGALTPYKGIRLLVETFNKLNKKLIVIGDGSEKKKLQAMANDNIEFLGSLPYDTVVEYIQNTRALLFPGEEDFGLIPLEVMSQGVPVIAYKKGGALETVVENRNDISRSSGIFFEQQIIDSLQEGLEYFESVESEFDPDWIRNHARAFGEDRFIEKISSHICDFLNNRISK
ncbi:glycosyltransferase [bacterium]|nr:glycosyltransferase [bacterium]